ncbi:MAG: mandelate racemase/muconate lactonizing enzyme family protein [Candidatus Bathyarchaeia archaeon]
MKITNIRVAVVEGNFYWPLVRIDTDEGISGYGEVRDHGRAYYDDRMKRLALDLKPFLIGEDPTNIERLFRRIKGFGGQGRQGGGVSGVEMALWDIFGKTLGVPVWRLLGGRYRDRVRIYCDCHAGKPIRDSAVDYALNKEDYTPEAYAKNAREIKRLGFTLLKFDIGAHVGSLVPGGWYDGHITAAGIAYEVSIVKALREAVGWETELALDCGQGTVEAAIRFGQAVEPYGLAWIEDLLWGHESQVEGFKEVTRRVNVPTLTGEDLYLREGFRRFIEEGAIRIPAPDMATAGGIMESKKIAELAELHGLQVAPHFAASPVCFMANLHAAAAMPNLIAVEFHAVSVPWWDSLVKGVEKPIIKNGYAQVPEKPGLGIELDEQAVRKHLKEGETFFE